MAKNAQDQSASDGLKATLTPTDSSLTVNQFVELQPSPGNVGICLSGGGSRALTAGMGQLRALKSLKTPDGRSLLSQTKAMSTVSGGSWVGVIFEYLTSACHDDDFLNHYVPDPGRLVPTRSPGHTQAEILDQLPEGNIGTPIASELFAPVMLGIEALLLYKHGNVPTDMLWQTLIGLHLLKPYSLYTTSDDLRPASLFSFNDETLDNDVIGPNPQLASQTAHLFADADDANRTRRPFLICNTAMFLNQTGTDFEFLAPVQATAFTTGIVGSPDGNDANGRPVGGGGVTSFAFSSNADAVRGNKVSVEQSRQLALMDIVGASSAFYAEFLQNIFVGWRKDVLVLYKELQNNREVILEWLANTLSSEVGQEAKVFLERSELLAEKEGSPEHGDFLQELKTIVEELQDIVPKYAYWPVTDAKPAEATVPTRFADGGNLENTGVANLLAYGDIDNVIAFVNSTTPLEAGAMGVIDADGKEIPGTRIIVDGQIPPLFGYQRYDCKKGYVLYAGAKRAQSPMFRHNQVFESSAFPEFLKGLWAASGNTVSPDSLGATCEQTVPGSNDSPAMLKQRLAVLENTWFGVRGQRSVNVLWVYTTRVKDWYEQLRPEVQEIMGPFNDPTSYDNFPHYSTLMTHLNPTQLNLLASLTAWSVGNPVNQEQFFGMFCNGSDE